MLAACVALGSSGHAVASDFPDTRHRVSFTFTLAPDVMSASAGYHYMFSPYVGIGGRLGIWGDPEQVSNIVTDTYLDLDPEYDYPGYYYDPYYHDFSNIALYVEPSVVISTPMLKWGEESGISLTANPWFRLSTNHYGESRITVRGEEMFVSYRSRFWAAGARIGPTAQFGGLGVSVGYEISNLDVDRRYRSNSRTYKSEPQHAIVIDVTLSF